MTIQISERYDLFSPEDNLGKKHQGSSKNCHLNTRKFELEYTKEGMQQVIQRKFKFEYTKEGVQQVIQVNTPKPVHFHNSPKNPLIELL